MPTTSSQPNSRRAGRFIREGRGPESFSAFHPRPLPPQPPLDIDAGLQELLDRANQALGRLDGITLLLPDADRFLYAYIRKEAVLSSQIEGTQSSLSDLLLFEHNVAPGVPIADVRETSNYMRAMGHGLARMREDFPLSLRLIQEIHGRLLDDVRGGERAPGEFRRTQNWIGGTRPGNARFVPPPAHQVLPAMGDLEKFLHDDPVQTPILVKAALAHAQFETIHPFLDGNGRVGRLLITLLLFAEPRVLSRPLLYLSLYLKSHRDEYYDHLQRIRTEGAWEEWLRFFLDGVIEVATSATETTRGIVRLVELDRRAIQNRLGRAAGSASRLHEIAVRDIAVTIPETARELDLSEVTVAKAAGHLEELGILREVTEKPRNKLFVYSTYLTLLNEGVDAFEASTEKASRAATG
jgi:Fic family protein